MIIRLGKRTDKREYLKTQKEAFPIINSRRDAGLFDKKIKQNEIFVICEDNTYLGHLCFSSYLVEPPFARSVFIEEMAIKKKFRGKGFGRALINYSIKYSKDEKIPTIYLSTGDYANNDSIKLYESIGFKKAGNLKDISPKSEYNYEQLFYGLEIK